MENRLKIGVMVSDLEDIYVQSLLAGIENAAEEINADVIVMPGRGLFYVNNLEENGKYSYQHNAIYQYGAIGKLDFILFDAKTVAYGLNMEGRKEFLGIFKDTPIISIGEKVTGYPTVRFDNKKGFAQGINKLITEYERKKIAFVTGPMDNADAIERFDVYKNCLQEHGMAYDEELVIYGTFWDDCDDQIAELMDRRIDIDAFVFSNDSMALSGYRVFEERKIEIGSEILVMGFDDRPWAVEMDIPLTSVKADAVAMGYKTVKGYKELLSDPDNELIIGTELIVRQSFGEFQIEFSELRTDLNGLEGDALSEAVLPQMYQFLFDDCYSKDIIMLQKKIVKDYVDYIANLIYGKPQNMIMYDVLEQKLSNWLKLEDGIGERKKVKIIEYLYYIVRASVRDVETRYSLAELFRNVYRETYLSNGKASKENLKKAEQINYTLTVLTRDMLNYTNGDERTYESMLDKMEGLLLDECYLYIYPDVHRYKKGDKIRMPSHLKLRICKNEFESMCPKGKEQIVETSDFLNNHFFKNSKRKTYITTVLFSADEQYGIIVAAVNRDNYKYMRVIARQFSSAVKTILLLEQNAKLTMRLEENIRQIKANNHVLSEISKRDELTGIYNRRGFISAVEEEINDPANRDKKAIIIYADMNNLKIINDKFGHEEGDFSLRLVATILKESFRGTDIIGRFGGDEFAAFALVNQDNYTNKIRERIEAITERENAKTEKEYYVSISIGICEFLCEDGVSIATVMDRADDDLYVQKKNKRVGVMK